MDRFYGKIGNKIKTHRKSKGLTRAECAFQSGISDKFLYDIEVGNKGMSVKTLCKISKTLGVTADYLLKEAYDEIKIY